MNLQWIAVGDTTYLGVIEEAGDNVTIKNAEEWGHSNSATIRDWFQNELLGELTEIRVKGATAYTMKDLSPKDKIYFAKCQVSMDAAEKYAIPELKYEYFKEQME